jgi:hypothetical protein
MRNDRRHDPATARIDLDTIRETLLYMADDMAHEAHLSKVHGALLEAIREIDGSMGRTEPCREQAASVLPFKPANPRFVRWVPEG